MREAGPWIVGAGLLLVVVGLLAWAGGLSWFGRLPGDIRYETERARVYIPIASSLVASLALPVLLSFLAWLLRR